MPRMARFGFQIRHGRYTNDHVVDLPRAEDAMQSWYQDLLEDRLTNWGHSLDAVFRLTADRSNPLVALKGSTRIVDRLETARS